MGPQFVPQVMTKERVWVFRDGINEGVTVPVPRSGCHAVAQGYGVVLVAPQTKVC